MPREGEGCAVFGKGNDLGLPFGALHGGGGAGRPGGRGRAYGDTSSGAVAQGIEQRFPNPAGGPSRARIKRIGLGFRRFSHYRLRVGQFQWSLRGDSRVQGSWALVVEAAATLAVDDRRDVLGIGRLDTTEVGAAGEPEAPLARKGPGYQLMPVALWTTLP
jgi:hypothetical protein